MADIESQVVGSSAPVETPQSDPVSSFSFADAHAKALEMYDGTPQGEQPVDQTPVVTPDAPQGDPAATNVDNASAKQLAQLKDEDIVKVTVDGEEVEMPWKDAKSGVMRQAHYTKSMQQLRQEQAAFNTERGTLTKAQQEREALVNLLNSEELMKEFLGKAYPQLLQQAQAQAAVTTQVDPNDIATVGQLQELQQAAQTNVQNLMKDMQNQLKQQLDKVTQTIEDRQATAKLSNEINGTIKDIFSENPFLKEVIPNAEQVLRYEVIQLQPKTPEETLAAFKQVASGWVETFNRTVEARNKTSVIQKQKLTSNNIQPPGGGQVQPQPSNFKKTNPMTGKQEIDWTALNAAAKAMLK